MTEDELREYEKNNYYELIKSFIDKYKDLWELHLIDEYEDK